MTSTGTDVKERAGAKASQETFHLDQPMLDEHKSMTEGLPGIYIITSYKPINSV